MSASAYELPKVVPDWSSILESREYGTDIIHANHMNMCRFQSQDDDGYTKFAGVLKRLLKSVKAASDSPNEHVAGQYAKGH